MKTLSIAKSMTPINVTGGTATNSVDTPLVPNTLQLMETFPSFHKTFGVSADQQTTNYFNLNEGYHQVGNGMFTQLTGAEPVYGLVEYDRNPLAQNQTNWRVNDVQKITRVQHNMGYAAAAFRTPAVYPTRRGRPDKTNYPASSWYAPR